MASTKKHCFLFCFLFLFLFLFVCFFLCFVSLLFFFCFFLFMFLFVCLFVFAFFYIELSFHLYTVIQSPGFTNDNKFCISVNKSSVVDIPA